MERLATATDDKTNETIITLNGRITELMEECAAQTEDEQE